jgi:DNA mismatch endonuclease (patch repair protein)
MPEKLSKEERSRLMSKIRSKNTKCELKLRQALRETGLKGYQVNYRDLPGTPDIVFVSEKIAIFCDSDFWHGHKGLPATNQEYWREKFRKNAERDALVNQTLQDKGWKVLRFPESEILKSAEECAKKIAEFFPNLHEHPGNSLV